VGSGAWGYGAWGGGSWGGGPGLSALSFVDAQPIRENVVRVQFSTLVYLTGLFDAPDAAITNKWQVNATAGTAGLTGDAARPVSVVQVALAVSPDDGITEQQVGQFVDLFLDRPMTPFPAQYDVSWSNIFSADLTTSTAGTFRMLAAYRLIAPPTTDSPKPARDFANPQVLSAAAEALPNPTGDPLALGTFGYGADGDYAFDQGTSSLKKRVIRRLVTKKNAFAHLPGYGVGVPDYSKQLGVAATLAMLRADAEIQIKQEPDVAQAKVATIIDASVPGLVWFRVTVKPRAGNVQRFDIPFQQQASP